MPSYAHKKLADEILRLNAKPTDRTEFSEWIEADAHLRFVETNAQSDEVVIHVSGPYSFIHSLVVPNSALSPVDQDDLLGWSDNPYRSIASYVSGGGRKGMWMERDSRGRGSKALDKGTDLIFGRKFEGWSKKDATYFEANQEFTHVSGVHWRHEYGAYCRFDENGDLEQVISVSMCGDTNIRLVSFRWSNLEEYLAVCDSSLVRMFDFKLHDRKAFTSRPTGREARTERSASLFYRQVLAGGATYTRGVQIIGVSKARDEIIEDIQDGWLGRRNTKYVKFIAHDWRNDSICEISTDPKATTNYFSAKDNNLPFELSPAFFRPEVLSKYKTDREKYKVSDRGIECRAAWSLRGYDVNEAGQIHAYICDLQALPYTEQLHWRAHNERPKAGISERAITNDFKNQFVTFMHPREEIVSIARRWRDQKVPWWTLRDADLLDRANPPLSSSRDEWAEAFLDLSQLLAEGFVTKTLRKWTEEAAIATDPQEQSISLLEKLVNHGRRAEDEFKLIGLRTAQRIRSKVKGHSGSSEAKKLSEDALAKHGSYAEHFKQVCLNIMDELKAIECACEVF
jgi:hypothetical protein